MTNILEKYGWWFVASYIILIGLIIFIPRKDTIVVCPVKLNDSTTVLEYPKTPEDCGTADMLEIKVKEVSIKSKNMDDSSHEDIEYIPNSNVSIGYQVGFQVPASAKPVIDYDKQFDFIENYRQGLIKQHGSDQGIIVRFCEPNTSDYQSCLNALAIWQEKHNPKLIITQ